MLYEFDQYLLDHLRKSTSRQPTDEELMSRIKRRDSGALALLYRKHARFLRGIAGGVLNSDHDVDDVIQETLLKIWHQAEHYDEKKGKALGWLVTLTRRRAIDRGRKTQAYSRARERFQAASQSDLPGNTNRGVEKDILASDMSEVLDRAMAILPAAQRQAIHDAFYRGLSQREIAAQTGIPLGTIKTRIQIALRKLRGAVLALESAGKWSLATT